MILVGFTDGDSRTDVEQVAKKIAQLRVFEDAEGKMNLSIKDVNGAILSVSQFTLYADCRKGNRPSFIQAARPEVAEPLYERVVAKLRERLGSERVGTGRFGADMKVRLLNDGPFSVELLA